MSIPQDLRYTKEHEWLRVTDGVALVGITEFAAEALGDIVFVQLPAVGDTVKAGEVCGEIESTKSVSDLYAPVSGTVIEVNTELEGTPELVNRDPYGDGWICVVRPDDAGQASSLLDAAAYVALTQD